MSELSGELIVKGDTEEIGTNGFKKRLAVIKTDGQYPQTILVEFLKDKCDLLNTVKIGDRVTIAYNLNGRSWTSPQGEVKYFNTINGWRIDLEQPSAHQPAQPQPTQPQPTPLAPLTDDEEGDIPF